MLDREEVEAMLAETRVYTGRKAGIIAELCRTWLAVQDAPLARVYVIGTGEGEDLLTLEPRDRQDRAAICRLHQSVRLVREGGE